MWQLHKPQKVKLIVGILAAGDSAVCAAKQGVEKTFGKIDLASNIWPFTHTDYYTEQMGKEIHRQFVSIEHLIAPEALAEIKICANNLEQQLAGQLALPFPRPVNLDPGYIEPSKLVLASTKNFSHRIYIGSSIWAEVTLIRAKAGWTALPYTFPDYRQGCYHEFFEKVRLKLKEQSE